MVLLVYPISLSENELIQNELIVLIIRFVFKKKKWITKFPFTDLKIEKVC